MDNQIDLDPKIYEAEMSNALGGKSMVIWKK